MVEASVFRRCRPLLGTYVEIAVPESPDHDLTTAVEAAFAAIERTQRLMSFHDPDSDLSRLNRRAHREPVTVDAWTHEVLTIAKDVFEHSDGWFDCSVGSRLVDWALLPASARPHARRITGLAALELDDEGLVYFEEPMCLDLGGIAKGYAVDRAIDALAAHGVATAVVNAGGDLRVLGKDEQAIRVRDPRAPTRMLDAGRLADGAFATSATYWSTAWHAGALRSALVDPRSGEAIVDAGSYSVVAPTCVLADALTKVLAVSRGKAIDCLAHYRAHPWVC